MKTRQFILKQTLISIVLYLKESTSQYEFINKKQEREYTLQQQELKDKVQLEIDFTEEFKNQAEDKNLKINLYGDYRLAIPNNSREYSIIILINPCGCNSTSINKVSKALGYDCCIHRYGRGEYSRLKRETNTFQNLYAIYRIGVSDRDVLASVNEIWNNIDLVDEYGVEIPLKSSRRAYDHLLIDDDCLGLRNPFDYCIKSRIRAVKSDLLAPCMDNNETIDATISCFTTDGKMQPNCMQFGYGQNTFIHICEEGEFHNDENCGTFVELHIPNGSPYDHEEDSLSDTKITARATNGVTTSTISLRYKNNPTKILCNSIETKIRVGSMVVISDRVPECCCPMPYIPHEKIGSLFCPKKLRNKGGPFADRITSLEEQLDDDAFQLQYPYCPYYSTEEEQQDTLMCSKQALGGFTEYTIGVNDNNNPTSGRFYTYPCQAVIYSEATRQYSSNDLSGQYEEKCPVGSLFDTCASMPTDKNCFGDDVRFTFAGEIGKVVFMPDDVDTSTSSSTSTSSTTASTNSNINKYGITFNNGRTVYSFYKHEIELLNLDYNYELWFVQRNRFEKIIKKKKPFRILWPPCTYDSVNDRYFPFTLLNKEDGRIQSISGDYDGRIP